jgi:NhaP-type Na+/H+ or K+/H+ antiporter
MPTVDLAASGLPVTAATLAALGAILALSIVCDAAARRLRLPRVTLLVVAGVVIAALVRLWTGRAVDAFTSDIAEPLLDVALVMVAFLLGGDLTAERWRQTGRPVLALSLAVSLASVALVGGGLLWLGFPALLAVPLAAMAVATDPAAVQAVVGEAGGGGRRGQVLRGVVAIDDAWGTIAFGVALATLGWLTGGDGWRALALAGWELGGSLLLGFAIGVPAAYLTARLQPGQPTQAEALAIILLIAGMADTMGVSSLLAGMTAGAVIANLGTHHERSFREIEQIEWPFLVLFFVAAGAAADPWRLARPALLPPKRRARSRLARARADAAGRRRHGHGAAGRRAVPGHGRRADRRRRRRDRRVRDAGSGPHPPLAALTARRSPPHPCRIPERRCRDRDGSAGPPGLRC